MKNPFKNIFSNFFSKREQKRKEIELRRKEEYDKLREKRLENQIFISNIKVKLIDLQQLLNDLENMEKRSSAIQEEIEKKSQEIEFINSKPSKFIFKWIDNWKIKKLKAQCDKQKHRIEDYEKSINVKKDEIKNMANGLVAVI